jgi:hypothetical protein
MNDFIYDEINCLHDKLTLTFIGAKLANNLCVNCNKECSGFFICLCGKRICLTCFEELNPEEKDKFKISNIDSCSHEKKALSFRLGRIDEINCINGCYNGNESYLICKCGIKLCIQCYENKFPDEKGRYKKILKPFPANISQHKKSDSIFCPLNHLLVYKVDTLTKKTCTRCKDTGLSRYFICEECLYVLCLVCSKITPGFEEKGSSCCKSCHIF